MAGATCLLWLMVAPLNSQSQMKSKIHFWETQSQIISKKLRNGMKDLHMSISLSLTTSCDCSAYQISIQNVVDAVCCMKKGKCADVDGLTLEHFHNAPFIFLQKLTKD